MSDGAAYVHEDEWGRVAFEPEENRDDRARVAAEVRAFSDAHRAPGGIGWTDLLVVPAAPMKLAERGITFEALREVLGDRAPLALTTGYSSHVEPVTNGFAFRCSSETYWDTIYGCTKDGIVTQLHLTFGTAAIAELLHRLGTGFRLVLSDPGRGGVIELSDRAAVERYLSDDDDA